MIVKTNQGYQVKSESGKNLSKPSLSQGQAKKRLAMVEWFTAHPRPLRSQTRLGKM